MVFPERMDKLNTEDVTGSLRQIESYLTYMCERIEHVITNINRSAACSGVSLQEVSELKKEVDTLKERVIAE